MKRVYLKSEDVMVFLNYLKGDEKASVKSVGKDVFVIESPARVVQEFDQKEIILYRYAMD